MKVNSRANKEKGILVQCRNLDYMYTWRYAGRFLIYATCPSCRRNVKISDSKTGSLQSAEVGSHSQIAAAVENSPAQEPMHKRL
jgi:hypothetical protein